MMSSCWGHHHAVSLFGGGTSHAGQLAGSKLKPQKLGDPLTGLGGSGNPSQDVDWSGFLGPYHSSLDLSTLAPNLVLGTIQDASTADY